mmetsp:Transcript_1920/g.4233  ORF Transcript_1920/g.4233 Transcript_1920/m.4233 type:complete len:353 (-) Transcript_1920:216-1274(-)
MPTKLSPEVLQEGVRSSSLALEAGQASAFERPCGSAATPSAAGGSSARISAAGLLRTPPCKCVSARARAASSAHRPWQRAASTIGNWLPVLPCRLDSDVRTSSSQRLASPRCTAASSKLSTLRRPFARRAPKTRAAPASPAESRRWPKAKPGFVGDPPLHITSHSAVSQQCHASARSKQLSPSHSFWAFTGTPSSSMSISAASVAPWEHTSQRRLTQPLLLHCTPKCTSSRARAMSPNRKGVKITLCGASGRAPFRRSHRTKRQSPSRPAARAAMSTKLRRRPRRTSMMCTSAPRSTRRAEVTGKFRATATPSSLVAEAIGSKRTRTSSGLSRSKPSSCCSAQQAESPCAAL